MPTVMDSDLDEERFSVNKLSTTNHRDTHEKTRKSYSHDQEQRPNA